MFSKYMHKHWDNNVFTLFFIKQLGYLKQVEDNLVILYYPSGNTITLYMICDIGESSFSDQLFFNEEVLQSFHLPNADWQQNGGLHHSPPENLPICLLADLAESLLPLLWMEKNRGESLTFAINLDTLKHTGCVRDLTLWKFCCLLMYCIWSIRWLRLFSMVWTVSLAFSALGSIECSPIWMSRWIF